MFQNSIGIVRKFLVLKNSIYLDISLKILSKKGLVEKRRISKKTSMPLYQVSSLLLELPQMEPPILNQ